MSWLCEKFSEVKLTICRCCVLTVLQLADKNHVEFHDKLLLSFAGVGLLLPGVLVQ